MDLVDGIKNGRFTISHLMCNDKYINTKHIDKRNMCFVKCAIKSALSQPENGVQLSMITSRRLQILQRYYNRKWKRMRIMYKAAPVGL